MDGRLTATDARRELVRHSDMLSMQFVSSWAQRVAVVGDQARTAHVGARRPKFTALNVRKPSASHSTTSPVRMHGASAKSDLQAPHGLGGVALEARRSPPPCDRGREVIRSRTRTGTFSRRRSAFRVLVACSLPYPTSCRMWAPPDASPRRSLRSSPRCMLHVVTRSLRLQVAACVARRWCEGRGRSGAFHRGAA